MKKQSNLKKNIIGVVDFFYLPFLTKLIDKQTFRYGVCGGVNLVFDALLYALSYNFIFLKENLELPFVTISPEIASFILVFPITFFTGFWLTKHISFEDKNPKTAQQRAKYLAVVAINIATKYWGIKLLVDIFSVAPSLSNIIMSGVTVIISYLLQRNYTFKKVESTQNH